MDIAHFEPQIAHRVAELAGAIGESPDAFVLRAVRERLEEVEDYLAARDVLAKDERVWTMEEVEARFGLEN